MKFRPTACCRIRTSPAPGPPTSTSSYTRASGPPTLCTRTALVMTVSPSVFQASSFEANRKPSPPPCQLTGRNRLFGGRHFGRLLFCSLATVTLGQHVEQLD